QYPNDLLQVTWPSPHFVGPYKALSITPQRSCSSTQLADCNDGSWRHASAKKGNEVVAATFLVDLYDPFADQHARPSNPGGNDHSFSLLCASIENARTSHFDSLGNAPMEAAVRDRAVVAEQPGQGAVRAASRGVLWDPIERCKHPRSDIELVATLGIQVDIGRHTLGHEGIEALRVDPRSCQRRPILE